MAKYNPYQHHFWAFAAVGTSAVLKNKAAGSGSEPRRTCEVSEVHLFHSQEVMGARCTAADGSICCGNLLWWHSSLLPGRLDIEALWLNFITFSIEAGNYNNYRLTSSLDFYRLLTRGPK